MRWAANQNSRKRYAWKWHACRTPVSKTEAGLRHPGWTLGSIWTDRIFEALSKCSQRPCGTAQWQNCNINFVIYYGAWDVRNKVFLNKLKTSGLKSVTSNLWESVSGVRKWMAIFCIPPWPQNSSQALLVHIRMRSEISGQNYKVQSCNISPVISHVSIITILFKNDMEQCWWIWLLDNCANMSLTRIQ